uniref:RNA-dependent RNA polymerase n=1 Tax=Riboviria sp. TaxID=2585031 RepID=A0A6M9Z887_9VIRU|nr:MAG: RNA-dependent RNA polymerase [Riboviria sp.]
MDCSNPVVDSSRATLKSILNSAKMLKRQDLMYLRELGDSARRALINMPDAEEQTVKGALSRLVPPELGESHMEVARVPCKKVLDFIPIASLTRDDGSEIRCSAVNSSNGRVSINRSFAQGKQATSLVSGLVRVYSPEEVAESMNSTIYSSGTVDGFVNRLSLMTSRKCVDIKVDPTGVVPAKVATLKKLLPVGEVKSWHAEDLSELLADVTTSKNASAGAPYWRSKGECLPDVLEYGVPALVDAIKGGPEVFKKFYLENPEMFVLECKNKTDRYEVAKLKDKTRPYFNTPAHIALLQSALMQPFCRALKLFTEGGRCRNAYGYTLAKGGGAALWKRMEDSLKTGTPFFFAYGDDVDLYVPHKGDLYRVSPDFKQMDYSVDYGTLVLTLDYIQQTYVEQHGHNAFWEHFFVLWKELLKDPRFLVQGTGVYTKNADGLMSGVVGTTLFDTVKSVLAYERYLVYLQTAGRIKLFSEHASKQFFEQQGLEIKAGTWNPEKVNMHLLPGHIDGNNFVPGRLPSENKFLGVQLMPVAGPKHVDFVPFLPKEDWLTCLCTPRDGPHNGRPSNTAKLRTHFDRMRGYLVTGAAFDESARNYCYSEIDRIPSDVILMQTQSAALGEIENIVGEEFEYPTSECVPHLKWIFDIYASEENKFSLPPLDVFEDRVLQAVRSHRLVDRRVKLEVKNRVTHFEPDTEEVELPDLGLPDKPARSAPVTVPEMALVPGAFKPITSFIDEAIYYIGDGVMTVAEVAGAMGMSVGRCAGLLHTEGLYLRDIGGELLVSQYPILFEDERNPRISELKQIEQKIESPSPYSVNADKAAIVANAAEVLHETSLPGPPILNVESQANFMHAKTIADRIANQLEAKFITSYKTNPVLIGEGPNKKSVVRVVLRAKFSGGDNFLTVQGPNKSSCTAKMFQRIIALNDAKISVLATAVVKTDPIMGRYGEIDFSNVPPPAEFADPPPPVGPQPYHLSWADENVEVSQEAPAKVRLVVKFKGKDVELELEEKDGLLFAHGSEGVVEAFMHGGNVRVEDVDRKSLMKHINTRNNDFKRYEKRRKDRSGEAKAAAPKAPAKRPEGRSSSESLPKTAWVANPDNLGFRKRSGPYNSQRSGPNRGVGANRANPRKSA